MDAIVTEAHFDTYVVGLVKTLVSSARRGRLAMLPVRDAWVLCAAAAAVHKASVGGAAVPPSALAAALRAASAAIGDGVSAASSTTLQLPVRYGEVFEGLLRCWRLLPLGLYRRVHPANGLKTAAGTVTALHAAAGLPTGSGGPAFGHNRALISYVFTNPTPETKLSPHDVLYVMHSSEGEEDVQDAVDMAASAAGAGVQGVNSV